MGEIRRRRWEFLTACSMLSHRMCDEYTESSRKTRYCTDLEFEELPEEMQECWRKAKKASTICGLKMSNYGEEASSKEKDEWIDTAMEYLEWMKKLHAEGKAKKSRLWNECKRW